MTNMEWYGSNLMRRHQHRFRPFFFFAKNRLSKILFKSFPKKTLRLWISKIRIWIWSEESTLSVDFMNSWSVFGYAPKTLKIRFWIRKSVFGFSRKNAPLPYIHVSSNGVSKKSNCWLCRVLTTLTTESALVSWKQVTWTCHVNLFTDTAAILN